MRRALRCVAAVAWGCLAAGCALVPETQAERVRLPELPPAWPRRFPGLCCELAWPGPDGSVRRLRLSGWPQEALLKLPRAAPVPVLAVPLHAGVELLPAGGLYPGEQAHLALSWAEGPVAACLLRLSAAGCDLGRLNTRRLLREAAALALADPWHLDTAHLSARILSGELRATDLRACELRSTRLALEPGAWIAASASAPAVVSDGEALIAAPDGLHRFFHNELALRLDLYVSGTGAAARLATHPF